jgi:hypothetical protein
VIGKSANGGVIPVSQTPLKITDSCSSKRQTGGGSGGLKSAYQSHFENKAYIAKNINDIQSADIKLQALIKEYKYPPLPLPGNIVTSVIN